MYGLLCVFVCVCMHDWVCMSSVCSPAHVSGSVMKFKVMLETAVKSSGCKLTAEIFTLGPHYTLGGVNAQYICTS